MIIKRIMLIFMALILFSALIGCDSSQPAKPETKAGAAIAESAGSGEKPMAEELAYPPVLPEDEEFVEEAHRLTGYLAKGEYKAAIDMFDAVVKNKAGEEAVWEQTWNRLRKQNGDFVKIGESVAGRTKEGGQTYVIVHHTLVFARSPLIQRSVFNLEGQVAGIFFLPGEVKLDYTKKDRPSKQADSPNQSLPAGLTETEVTIESQPGYPLQGSLTRPAGPVRAVLLLIPGSGPNDRDETMGPNKPFRDLAHGLAQKGLASLRLDKISHSHALKLASHPDLSRFTVDEEFAIDAVNAFNWLKKQDDFQGRDIFLLGHSQGGALVAYINSKGVDAAGYIILSSITRPLWQVQYDQNVQLLEEFKAAGRMEEAEDGFKMIEVEAAKARALEGLTEEELLKETVFGLPAWYVKHLSSIDPPALHLADPKPVLVLHGGRDRQVSLKDFQSWQDGLKEHPDASFRLYDRLNHLFGDYQGEPVPYSKMVEVEYAQPTPVPQYVIDDISEWISGHLTGSN